MIFCRNPNTVISYHYFTLLLFNFAAHSYFSAGQRKFYGVDNTETATPGYRLVNAGAGCALKNKKGNTVARLIVNVNNLLNTSYQSHLNRLKYFEYYQQSPNGRKRLGSGSSAWSTGGGVTRA